MGTEKRTIFRGDAANTTDRPRCLAIYVEKSRWLKEISIVPGVLGAAAMRIFPEGKNYNLKEMLGHSFSMLGRSVWRAVIGDGLSTVR